MKKPRKDKRTCRFANERGVVLIVFAFILMATVAFAALTIDGQRWISEIHTLGNVGDNMAISALDCYYNDRTLEDIFKTSVELNGRQRMEARMVSGLRCAQNIFENSDTNMFFEKAKMWDPFANFDWVSDYDLMLDELRADSPHQFHNNEYFSGAVHFLDDRGNFLDPRNENAWENAHQVYRSEVQFEHDPSKGGVKPIFSRDAFYAVTTASAEVDNAGCTRSVVLAMDRSFSMCESNLPGLSIMAQRHAGQFDNVICKPMQNLLEAAKILPEILDEGNRFRDERFNNSFGLVMFDVVAEALRFAGGCEEGVDCEDIDPYLSHDESGDGYQEVIDVLDQTVAGTEVPRIGRYGNPYADPPTSDFRKELAVNPGDPCFQENPSGCNPATDPTCRELPDACHHDSFLPLDQFKRHWYNNLIAGNPLTPSNRCEDLWRIRDGMPVPYGCHENKYLGTFSPWTQTAGDIGFQVAIEMIRKERERLRQEFGDEFVEKKFCGEIIYLSDVFFNAYGDRNASVDGPDNFPMVNTDTGSYSCDELGITDSGDNSDAVIYPASWREFVTQPVNMGDFYHDGTTMWTVANFDPDDPDLRVGFEPNGVKTNQNRAHADIHLHVDSASCPGPDCVGNVSACIGDGTSSPTQSCRQRGKLARSYHNRTIPDDTPISCADLAVMDYAMWAEANKITVHGLGFELPRAYDSNPTRRRMRRERLYVLDVMQDPSQDGRNVGLVFTDVHCESGGCPEVEQAFRRIGRNIRVRLS